MKRTYVDAGVLIAAARGDDATSAHAMAILADPDRGFVSSIFVKLEVLPKPIYLQRQTEVEFYEAFFAAVTAWADPLEEIAAAAYQEACNLGLAALDALHLAAAQAVGATEFVTTEKPDKPIHRTTLISMVSIYPTENA
jgi:predicted nucleic acid-binding protein